MPIEFDPPTCDNERLFRFGVGNWVGDDATDRPLRLAGVVVRMQHAGGFSDGR
ncbi:MAG: hypothetical protein MI923_09735 [Phycisphaerales bacterium]|nr:hypothetical protein [Phycisphaerales bacterium]